MVGITEFVKISYKQANKQTNKSMYSGGKKHSSVDDASEDAHTVSTKERISAYPPCLHLQAHDFPHNTQF